jgi:hypothetical protein
MVTLDARSLRLAAARFAVAMVPLASKVVIAAERANIAFLPNLRVFVDPVEESISAAITGDGPSEHWGAGDEPLAPIAERTAFEAMPGYDDLPTLY